MKNATAKTNHLDRRGIESSNHKGDNMKQTAFAMTPVFNIQMVRERELMYDGNRVTAPAQAAAAFCALLGDPDREYFVAFLLDNKNRITGVHTVSQGSLNQSIVHPRETFKAAILANCAAVIISHNLCGAPHKLCNVKYRVM